MAASSSGSACSSANCVPGDGGCPCVAASATCFGQTFSGTSPRCAKHGSHMCCQQPGPLHPTSLNAWHFFPVSCQAPAAAQSLPKHGNLACESFRAPRGAPFQPTSIFATRSSENGSVVRLCCSGEPWLKSSRPACHRPCTCSISRVDAVRDRSGRDEAKRGDSDGVGVTITSKRHYHCVVGSKTDAPLAPRASWPMPYASRLVPRASRLVPRASCLVPRTAHHASHTTELRRAREAAAAAAATATAAGSRARGVHARASMATGPQLASHSNPA